jgi:hypothetical protein
MFRLDGAVSCQIAVQQPPMLRAGMAELSAPFGGLGQYDPPKSVSEANLRAKHLNGGFVRKPDIRSGGDHGRLGMGELSLWLVGGRDALG